MTETTDHDTALAPPPRSPFRSRIARWIMRPAAQTTDVRVLFPGGSTWGAGGPESPEMVIHRPDDFFGRLGQDAKIGFGESYVAGDWGPGPGTDLADLLTPFAARMGTLVPPSLQRMRWVVEQSLRRRDHNTIDGSRVNIHRHYDLSNELFELFLDPTMTYSAAWFGPGDDLESAQIRKLDAILDDAGVTAGTRMLEIGTGWGSLALRAAQRGAVVTTITISSEQAALARQRFDAAGVDVDLRICDYREITGSFDAICSIEMIEAVGEDYWPAYFDQIDALLAPGGRVALQAITMDHHRFRATRRSYGWIHKYIFPGGLIPSLRAIEQSLARHTRLGVSRERSLGPDYARTLRLWREAFEEQWMRVRDLGFDEDFRRIWEFYLAYCEAGFASGYLDVQQLTITEVGHG